MNRLVSTFPKNKFEEVRVQVKEIKGGDLIDIRVYSAMNEGEEKIPTGKGLSLDVRCFQELKKSLSELESTLKENGLLHE